MSYAKEDQGRAEELAAVLESKGWSVWWDRQIPPGRTFDEVIEEALTQARCVIVLWSPQSVASRWVRTEASVAAERGILVPALIEEVSIPLEFRRLQAANLIDWHGKPDDEELSQLVDTVGRLVSLGPVMAPPPRRPAAQRVFLRMFSSPQVVIPIAAFVAGAALTYFVVSGGSDSRQTQTTDPSASTASGPAVAPTQQSGPVTVPVKGRINLLAQKNGGHLLAAPNESWNQPIDGVEDWDYINEGIGKEAVYGFKDDQPATFDTFGMLIGETHDWNVKAFELFVGNDNPLGYFESVGTFETKNIRQFPSAWQEFKFPAQRAKYFKVRLISTFVSFPYAVVWQWRLMGNSP